MGGDQTQIDLSLICGRVQGSSPDVLQRQNKALLPLLQLTTMLQLGFLQPGPPWCVTRIIPMVKTPPDVKKKKGSKLNPPSPPPSILSVAFPKRKQVIYTYIYTHTGRAQDYGQLLGWQQ